MKRILYIILFSALAFQVAMAQKALMIKHADGVTDAVSTATIDSLSFSEDGSLLTIASKEGKVVEISASGIKLSYDEMPTTLTVKYDGTKAEVVNPFLLEGVTVAVAGADVTINNSNESKELSFTLSGETSDGSFLYNGTYKTTIVLNGVSITNTKGAAIDIECGKRIALELKKGTVNTLADCAGGNQKAALYCKGHLEIDKAGTLNVTGNTKHAISAKEYIKLKKSEGTINILGATSDGIHCGQYFLSNGFTVNIQNIGDDGIQAELSGDDPYEEDYPDGSVTIQDGKYNIEMTADGSKGIKADGELVIGREDGTGPVMRVSTTGGRLNDGDNSGGTQPGGWGRPGGGGGWPGGPGGGSTSSGSSSKAIKAEGAAYVKGGSLFVTTSTDGAEGLESKTSVTISGGTHYFQCYDDCINSAGKITFASGTTVCYSNGNDAVDSNYGKTGAITISGGNIFAYSTKGGPEEGLDCDNNSYITVTGGIAVSAGGSQGGGGGWGGSSSSSIGSSTQGYYLGSSPSSYNTTYYYTLCNTSGTPICTYKFAGNVSNSLSLLTAPNLGKGSITVKTGSTKPTACDVSVNDVFFINPTVATTGTAATVTSK